LTRLNLYKIDAQMQIKLGMLSLVMKTLRSNTSSLHIFNQELQKWHCDFAGFNFGSWKCLLNKSPIYITIALFSLDTRRASGLFCFGFWENNKAYICKLPCSFLLYDITQTQFITNILSDECDLHNITIASVLRSG
jgi:hypothetical protein